MPIVVVCPCGAKLKAPDAAAGKRVKCPKCASALLVPAPEADYVEVEDDPLPAPTPAKKKPMLVDDDDAPRPAKKPTAARSKPAPVEVNEAVDDDEDDAPKAKRRRDEDEDDDDTPKKRKGKKGKKEQAKSKLPLILGIGGGVFVLLTVVGIIVGVMMSGNGGGPTKGTNTQPTTPPKPALPPGWSEFKGDGFSVAVPDAIQFKQQEQGPNRPGQPPAGTKTYANGVQPQPQPNGPPLFAYVVSVGDVPAAAAAEFAKSPEAGWEAIKKQGGGGAQLQNEKTIRVGSVEGRQYTLNAGFVAGIVRVVVKGDKVYSWVVMSQVAPAEDAPEVKSFFDTFKLD